MQHAWPAEWATCLGEWCDRWQHWLRNERSPTRDGDDAVERAAEGLGFLLGLDGARELRERRDVKRKRRRERDAEVAREAQETAASIVEFFGDASTARHLFTRLLKGGQAGALYEAALRARLTCLMLDDADPLAEPLSRASLAILRLADLPDDRDAAEAIWSAVERAIRVLADTIDTEASRVRH